MRNCVSIEEIGNINLKAFLSNTVGYETCIWELCKNDLSECLVQI
jgi:hypothetical protein